MLRVAVAAAIVAVPTAAAADAPAAGSSYAVDTVSFEGLAEASQPTILALFPRPVPARFTGAELIELRRRIKNLALFDLVEVEVLSRALLVRVRRKAPISPIFDLSTGKTLRDTKVTAGVIHNDIDGRASRLGARASYSERGPNFALWLHQHPYGPRRWANEYEVYYAGSGFRFDDGVTRWQRNRLGGEIEWLSPSLYTSRFRYELQLNVYRESVSFRDGGSAPGDGMYFGTTSEIIWDRYTWNDLVPSGIRVVLEVRPGVFLGAAGARHEARFKTLAALPLGGRTVLVGYLHAAAVNAGNVNHSVLLGSVSGVRGLADSLYRNDAQSFTNIELRHAFELGKRWYLQAVAFTDAARFRPMNARGDVTTWRYAWSTGAGVRLLPTAFVDTLLRLDVARLHAPEGSWFVQLGINQYI